MSESLEKGWFAYKNCTVMQHPDVFDVFDRMFQEVRPSTILEIGSAQGGFTIALRDILDKHGLVDSKVVTWDIHDAGKKIYDYKGVLDKIDCRVENIFTHRGDELNEDNREKVTELVQRDGVTVVCCDGGNKLLELQVLSRLLKPGDIIMAHDYHPDKDKYTSMSKEELVNNNIWPFCETWDAGVNVPDDVLPYKKEEFERVAWLCMRRDSWQAN